MFKVNNTPSENEVFRKIKEMSSGMAQPRPLINTAELAASLGVIRDLIVPSLNSLKQSRLINFNDTHGQGIKLTLLGTVVNRDKVDKV